MNKPTQATFATAGFEAFRKPTRRQKFLAEMDRLVPWSELLALLEPAYAKGRSGQGRPPIPLERMLRIYFLQHWFNLSDPAVEEALYESVSMRTFAGIDLGREGAPDETTVCKFRHLLEEHGLGKRIFEEVGRCLQSRGLKVSCGTIVDAAILAAPGSTKNAEGKRDPQMHQTRKGKNWRFGMKAHVGVDSKTKLIHSVAATAAKVADGNMVGGSARQGDLRLGRCGPRGKNRAHPRQGAGGQGLHAAPRPGLQVFERLRSLAQPGALQSAGAGRARDRRDQAPVRLCKARYRGIAKNAHRLFVTCALANLFMARHRLLRRQGA